MFGLGMSEIILLGVLALIIIGPKQLPEVARALGRLINDIKRSAEDLTGEIKRQARVDLEIDEYLKKRKENEGTEQPLQTKSPTDHAETKPQSTSQDDYLAHIQPPAPESSIGKDEDKDKNKDQNAHSTEEKPNTVEVRSAETTKKKDGAHDG